MEWQPMSAGLGYGNRSVRPAYAVTLETNNSPTAFGSTLFNC